MCGSPVESRELERRDVLQEDEDKLVAVLGEQAMCGHLHLQAAPVAAQVAPAQHAHRASAAVDAFSYVVHDALSHLRAAVEDRQGVYVLEKS